MSAGLVYDTHCFFKQHLAETDALRDYIAELDTLFRQESGLKMRQSAVELNGMRIGPVLRLDAVSVNIPRAITATLK